MDQVWASEIASLRDQASLRSGYVVCTADAYMALVDGARMFWGAQRLDRLNGTNHAKGLSSDGKYLGRVCRNIDDVLTFSEEEARRMSTEMGWANDLEEEPFIHCTVQEMAERRAAAITKEWSLPESRLTGASCSR